ncbi:MAG: ABC transporter ATP-binding protein [Rhodobacteraceae bacterium]|nr:ABC transporter ATP-binding protein [Paracoccaceae bacterium]
MNSQETPLLQVRDLAIGFGSGEPLIRDINFDVSRGETLALVGESGSGKTQTCRAILRILPKAARIHSGSVLLNSETGDIDLIAMSERKLRDIRGNLISMIFQEPMHSLSPLHRVGAQVSEVLCLHRGHSKRSAKEIVLQAFERVGFPEPEQVYRSYPFELSGGMRQRAMIAMAMVAKPDLLIADEPTTALDVTTQAQVLGLIRDLQQETGMAVILVTHDLGVVANCADKVVVMRNGRIMESGPVATVLDNPVHGYTQKLIAAAPSIPHEAEPTCTRVVRDPILQLENISKSFDLRGGSFLSKSTIIKAVRGVNITVERGGTFAIVGESGSGKSTVAQIALGARTSDAGGIIRFWPKAGEPPIEVQTLSPPEKRNFQRQAQMVFQDPFSSLSPRMQVIDILTEPLEIHQIGTRLERKDRAIELLEQVGLDPSMLRRYPHAFSGGQRQRLSIARALALNPSLLVCDEPTSALDLSVQMQVLELLEEIRDNLGLSYLFISHDLAVVSRIADEVAVMRRGQIVEQAAPDVLFTAPKHPYTKALIAACLEPSMDQKVDLEAVAIGAGNPDTWPESFRFTGMQAPDLVESEPGHFVRVQL